MLPPYMAVAQPQLLEDGWLPFLQPPFFVLHCLSDNGNRNNIGGNQNERLVLRTARKERADS